MLSWVASWLQLTDCFVMICWLTLFLFLMLDRHFSSDTSKTFMRGNIDCMEQPEEYHKMAVPGTLKFVMSFSFQVFPVGQLFALLAKTTDRNRPCSQAALCLIPSDLLEAAKFVTISLFCSFPLITSNSFLFLTKAGVFYLSPSLTYSMLRPLCPTPKPSVKTLEPWKNCCLRMQSSEIP